MGARTSRCGRVGGNLGRHRADAVASGIAGRADAVARPAAAYRSARISRRGLLLVLVQPDSRRGREGRRRVLPGHRDDRQGDWRAAPADAQRSRRAMQRCRKRTGRLRRCRRRPRSEPARRAVCAALSCRRRRAPGDAALDLRHFAGHVSVAAVRAALRRGRGHVVARGRRPLGAVNARDRSRAAIRVRSPSRARDPAALARLRCLRGAGRAGGRSADSAIRCSSSVSIGGAGAAVPGPP